MKLSFMNATISHTDTIEIKQATLKDLEVLALLGRVTFRESHSKYIEDKTNLNAYLEKAFSVSTTKKELANNNNLYFILYRNQLPVGYVKLVLNAPSEFIENQNCCRLERIYVLDEFITHKFGLELFKKTVEKAKELQFDMMWLTVYIKNTRAINFYEKNEFKEVGSISFQIGEQGYENPILAKKL
ncbi:GNAT family N-acetyltransferase [Tenacibaculum jejuense]|uniref:GCN5-related N-acetyltransferase n=1 Tax=Tenacibaculum jejuense TaxID=584609 RepID=A0A238UA78_9FLAO|nr:GNAT family N-acetyltransferase [Tenacibaculum jejuense]SNR15374.1 GCN5-related N-acetyltransferase [Tenacibaculum jejuense]